MTRRVSAILKPKYDARRALKRREELARKAQAGLGAPATSTVNEGPLGASEKGNDALGAVEDKADGLMSGTEAVPTPMSGSAVPETSAISSVRNTAEKDTTVVDDGTTGEDGDDSVVFVSSNEI